MDFLGDSWNNALLSLQQAVQNLNPVPEGLWALVRSPYHWLSLWIGWNALFGRLFFGRAYGPPLGMAWACWVWWQVMPDHLAIIIQTITVLGGGWLLIQLLAQGGRSRGWQRLLGSKVCPYCAELIRGKAIRCKHCYADLVQN